MTQFAEVRRKNNGQQFTVVDDSRFIFHWHRDGEALPKIIRHKSGVPFLLTAEAVEQARQKQRSRLLKFDIKALPYSEQERLSKLPVLENGKGSLYVELPKETIKDVLASVALYVVTGGLACWAAWEVVKVLQ